MDDSRPPHINGSQHPALQAAFKASIESNKDPISRKMFAQCVLMAIVPFLAIFSILALTVPAWARSVESGSKLPTYVSTCTCLEGTLDAQNSARDFGKLSANWEKAFGLPSVDYRKYLRHTLHKKWER